MGTTYVLVGGAGYVAPKHYKAIKETGGELLAILDPHDSVGIIDSYFKDCKYFREFERFDRFCIEAKPDFVVVCSPNYLHSAHSLFGLRIGADVICEKPLVLNPRNIDALRRVEMEHGNKIWNILQLRLSPLTAQMRMWITECNQVVVTYYTPRGDWYDYSWKNDMEKSGGLFTNIGIHLLDLLLQLFGDDWSLTAATGCNKRRGNVRLQIGNTDALIKLSIEKDKNPTRIFQINGHEFDLSQNFGDLHTLSYQKILAGVGFSIDTVLPAIALCSYLRKLR